MDNFFSLIVFIAAIYLTFKVGRILFVYLAYKGVAVANLHHTEVRFERDLNARGALHKYYIPVYEYEVDGVIYNTEAMRYKNDPDLFVIEGPCVVRYNTADPRECAVKGSKCKFRFTRDLNEKKIKAEL